MKTILLVSGGLDSYIAYKYLEENNCKLLPLFIDYKGLYTSKELKHAKELFPDLIIDNSLDLSGQELTPKAFIKNRNAYFVLVGSKYGHIIAMGGLKDDNVGDKSPLAFLKMQELLNEINPDIYKVFSPFWRMTKSEIIEWYIQSGNHIEVLLKTTSCYHPTELYCGECPSCFRKYCAFFDNGLGYLLPGFNNLALVKKYVETITFYDSARQKSILGVAEYLGVI